MVQHVGHELRVLAVARSRGGQGKYVVHHQLWLVSLSSHAIWPVQRSCDLPAYHKPRAVGTYLGECDCLLKRCERHLQDLPRKYSQPESRAVPEVWTEAEASEVLVFKPETTFLGRRVDGAGVHVMDDHVRALLEWPEPTRRKQVEQFLGFVNYHRGFIQDFAKITAPLYELTGPKARWKWGDEQAKAFADLKKIMVTAPVLACPRADDPFILDTDTSDFAIGAVLSQIQDGKERPDFFASKVLNSAQRAYYTTQKELLAVVVFTRHFRHYLLGRVFLIRTDHASLVWLMRFKQFRCFCPRSHRGSHGAVS